MPLHKDLTVAGGIHIAHSKEYANAAARAGDLTLVMSDIGKVARQIDTGEFYILKSLGPTTWKGPLGEATGGASLSDVNPVMDGAAAPGVGEDASRYDHVHPTDTSRAPVANPTFTGTVNGVTAAMVGLGNVDNVQQIPMSQRGAANGVPTTDGSNKIPVEFLPNSVMEYKGNWDASTNTPTLTDVGGNAGDTYTIVNGTARDLGSGSVDWTTGNRIVHNGTIFEESGFIPIDLSGTNPLMDGAAAPGASSAASRSDHVHPTDTSRAAASHSHTQAESHNSPDTDTATSALHHTLGTGANQAAPGNHGHTIPSDIAGAWFGKPDPAASPQCFQFIAARAMAIPESGHRWYSQTLATAATTFTIKKNGSTANTFQITAASTGTFTVTGGLSLVAGDVLTIEPPATPDATLEHVAFTFFATASV